MKKNRKGFTLVELIVCIAILAAISVAGTFGLMSTLKKNRIADYKNDLSEVMRAAYSYTGMKGIYTDGSVTIEILVTEGLLDTSLYKKTNALTCAIFNKDDNVYYTKNSNELKFYMQKTDGTKLYMNQIADDETIVTDCN